MGDYHAGFDYEGSDSFSRLSQVLVDFGLQVNSLHAHLKDHVGTYPDWEHRIPGQGDVDYLRVIQTLREIHFSEAISIETFTDMDFNASCEEGYAAFGPLLTATETGL